MNRKLKISIGVSGFCLLVLLLLAGWMYWQSRPADEGKLPQHIRDADADPTLGLAQIPADHLVDASFTSHLPLVIIDTNGQEIINYKTYDPGTNSFVEPEGVDPYVSMEMLIIDNPNHINTLSDQPTVQTLGEIKVRGNNSSSDNFPKKQYRIKLYTEDGEDNDISILGMEPESDWILNGTQRDRSFLRNYLAFTIGGSIMSYTPDMEFCEVIFRNGNTYEYRGLYAFYETIKPGAGRVDIDINDDNAQSYIVRRDRFDPDSHTLYTWSKSADLDPSYGASKTDSYFALIFPKEDKVTEDFAQQVTDEFDQVEEALYSDDIEKLISYRSMVDVDSFVDYFLINEFFLNYDAGEYSTYFYKNRSGKIAIGPIWDFDGAIDNHDMTLDEFEKTAMQSRPWFERMVVDEGFTSRVEQRYAELRNGILSDEALTTFLDEAYAFLGNAVLRDESRWKQEYTYQLSTLPEQETALMIDRSAADSREELERMKAILLLHAQALDTLIPQLHNFSYSQYGIYTSAGTLLAMIFFTIFFSSIVLVMRVRKGQ